MMNFSFDLISDLHVESWGQFDWTDQATSPYCVVAGDVSRDHELVLETLVHLSHNYAGVFYIDGNDEHRWRLDNIVDSQRELFDRIEMIPNVVAMPDNVVITNGVALLATNSWWTFDFDRSVDPEQTQLWYQDYTQARPETSNAIHNLAHYDAAYLKNSVHKLQTHQEVKKIVLVTHTVPDPRLIAHDLDLEGSYRFNCMGNSLLDSIFEEDTENKISAWCFGHYHKSVDQAINGVRYVCNPRGRGDTPWKQSAFYPKKIEIVF